MELTAKEAFLMSVDSENSHYRGYHTVQQVLRRIEVVAQSGKRKVDIPWTIDNNHIEKLKTLGYGVEWLDRDKRTVGQGYYRISWYESEEWDE